MTADPRRLDPPPSDTGAWNEVGLGQREAGDAPLAALRRKLRHVAEERTALLSDLTRLVQELDAAAQPGHEHHEGEDQNLREERRAKSQIRVRQPDTVLASVLQTPDPQDWARPCWLCLVPPMVAAYVGQSALLLARTCRLIYGPGWMVLRTALATVSHFSRVGARITGTCGRSPAAADGRMVVDGKRATQTADAADFDEP